MRSITVSKSLDNKLVDYHSKTTFLYYRLVKNICIVFSGQQYSAWKNNGIIDNLKKHFNLEIILLNSQQIFEDVKIFRYGNCSQITKWLYSVNQVAKRKNSKTFNARFRRLYFSSLNLNSNNLTIKQKIIGVVYISKQFVGYTRRNILQTVSFLPTLNKLFYILLMKIFKKKIKNIQSSQYNFIKSLNSQILIFPSTGAEEVIFELFELARIENKKTIMVIENWDNLTSKTTFPINPDFITVMGKKSLNQAHDIHEIPSENIHTTGLPKFEKIIEQRLVQQYKESSSAKIKFLYLGYSLPYNEHKVVELLHNTLLQLFGYEGYELTYRPHPFKQNRFFENELDIPLGENFKIDLRNSTTLEDSKILPTIDMDYVSYLKSFDLIITTPTTMVLEIMLLGLPCLVDGLDDGIHITSPFFTLNQYLHQEDLLEIPELKIANNSDELINGIQVLLKDKTIRRNYSLQNILETDSKFSSKLSTFLLNLHLN